MLTSVFVLQSNVRQTGRRRSYSCLTGGGAAPLVQSISSPVCVHYEQLLLFEIKTHELYVYSGGDVVDLGRASCLIRGCGATTEPTVNWNHVHVFSSPTFPHQALEGVLTAREVGLVSRSRLHHLLSTEPWATFTFSVFPTII